MFYLGSTPLAELYGDCSLVTKETLLGLGSKLNHKAGCPSRHHHGLFNYSNPHR